MIANAENLRQALDEEKEPEVNAMGYYSLKERSVISFQKIQGGKAS